MASQKDLKKNVATKEVYLHQEARTLEKDF